MTQETVFTPTLSCLSDTDKTTIYHAALQVLERTGMTLQHEPAVNLLIDAGCRRDAQGRITIPAGLVEKAIDTAPSNISIFNRLGDRVMDLGGRRAYFGTGSDLMYHVDGRTLDRAHERLNQILANHQPNPIEPDKAGAIETVVNGFRPDLTGNP